jgi:hypothetical protein
VDLLHAGPLPGGSAAAQRCLLLQQSLVGVAFHAMVWELAPGFELHSASSIQTKCSVLCRAVLGMWSCRFLRIRSDKSPEDASGPDLVQQLYNKQNRRVHHD